MSIGIKIASLFLGVSSLFLALQAGADQVEIRCASKNFRTEYCAVDGRIVDVVLTRQLSHASCDRNWTWDRGGITVNNGCRAEFLVTRRGGHHGSSGGYTLESCSSIGRNPNTCYLPGWAYDIQLEQVVSHASCNYNWTWGSNYIFVDNGCRAVFRVYYR